MGRREQIIFASFISIKDEGGVDTERQSNAQEQWYLLEERVSLHESIHGGRGKEMDNKL